MIALKEFLFQLVKCSHLSHIYLCFYFVTEGPKEYVEM